MRLPPYSSILIMGVVLLMCTALSSMQSGSHLQQAPRAGGLTASRTTPVGMVPERRVALVIGNAAYQHTTPLTNPVNDAEDIAMVLKDLQFEVILKTNATLHTMLDALLTFSQRLRGGGVGLFYYAGHGLQVKGENYLLPIDAEVMREENLKRNAMSLTEILEKIDEAKSRLNLVFLDACRNNPFPRSVRAASRGLAGMDAPIGTLLVFATNPDNVAQEGTGRNGVYTQHLLRYITEPNLEVSRLLRRVRAAVREETKGYQIPWEHSSIEDDFYFKPMSDTPTTLLPASSPAASIVGSDGVEMVLVPAGEFIMGSDKKEIDHLPQDWPNAHHAWFEDEMPRHRVYLDHFYMDKYEVTNARFQRFVQATAYRTDAERKDSAYVDRGETFEIVKGASWRAPRGPGSSIAGLEQHPVVHVSQEDAKAYCAWAGKRLPTEAEWEKAARGVDGRLYPWGKQFDATRTNFCDAACQFRWKDRTVDDGYCYTAPVGSYEGGRSPYGVYDMAGNVWEWVSDWYSKDYYRNSPARNPQGPGAGEQAVLRGGGWNLGALDVRTAYRNLSAPTNGFANGGFRCAQAL